MNDMVEEFETYYNMRSFEVDEVDGCVEEGSWEQDGKYQLRGDVYQYKERYFRVYQSRSGSYHSDWYYDDPAFEEVRPKTVTITKTVYE